jgi:GTP-binding protein
MQEPVVAIVGRPNVGKSTLFNRILRRREAIVDDTPGVTRDRKSAVAEWAGRRFRLVDTGGYLPGSGDVINSAVLEQVRQAMEEADVIVFLVDGRAGVTSLDSEIATLLLKIQKPVLLAVNKVDTAAVELNVAEFYALGLGDPLPISAESGRRLGDFLDELVAVLPEKREEAEENGRESVHLAVVGRPNVGKSSFVNRLLGEERQIVTEVPGTTRDAVDATLVHQGQVYVLIDTAGLRRRARVSEAVEYYSTVRSLRSIRRADVVILLIDATEGLTDQDIRILEQAIKHGKGIVLAVNKWDLVEKSTTTARDFEAAIRDKLRGNAFMPVLFISAKTGQRVFRALEVARSVYEERRKTIKTSELNKFLAEALADYAPPSMDRREVKIKYCTQVKTNPPVFAFFANAPASIPANYRQYLENRLRERFGFFGVPLTLVFRKK